MFFIASKLFWFFTRPLNALFLLALLAGLLALIGRRRLVGWLFALSALAFAALGFTQLPDLLIYRLETHVVAREMPPDPAGIIVLGGGLAAESAAVTGGYHLGEAADRLIKGLELKRHYPAARLIYSGGLSTLLQQGVPETSAARSLVEALYGDTRGIEFESQSRNTWENAVFTAKMAGADDKRPWLLVTSAFHMPRALGCFRAAGMNVIPVPSDYRADPFMAPYVTGNMAGQFLKTSIVVKEWIGLLAYWLTGRIETLLPR